MTDVRRSVVGVYIQDVVRGDGVTPKTSYRERCEHRTLDVQIVDNYVDVALDMYTKGLLGLESLRRIAYDAVHELADITIEGFKESKMIRKADKKMAVSRESDDTMPASKSSPNLAPMCAAEEGGEHGDNPAAISSSQRFALDQVDQTSYIWDARVAELRYSVGRVNAVLGKTRLAFHKVATSRLCQHKGGNNMARVKYHDAVLAARYHFDEELQQARTNFNGATKAALLGGFARSASGKSNRADGKESIA